MKLRFSNNFSIPVGLFQARRGFLLFIIAAVAAVTGVEAQVVADTLERGVELREVVVKSKKEKYS